MALGHMKWARTVLGFCVSENVKLLCQVNIDASLSWSAVWALNLPYTTLLTIMMETLRRPCSTVSHPGRFTSAGYGRDHRKCQDEVSTGHNSAFQEFWIRIRRLNENEHRAQVSCMSESKRLAPSSRLHHPLRRWLQCMRINVLIVLFQTLLVRARHTIYVEIAGPTCPKRTLDEPHNPYPAKASNIEFCAHGLEQDFVLITSYQDATILAEALL